MTLNEALTKQNFVSKILLSSGDKELSKDLKVKVMGMRIDYGKLRKQFDEDIQEFVKGLSTDELSELQNKTDRTEEEEAQLKKLVDDLNESYQKYVMDRGNEEVTVKDYALTEDDFNEILDVNSSNDVEVNGTKINSADFLEILHTLFFE